MSEPVTPTDRYRFCNHHHELTSEHELVDFGTGPFVANKKAIPLLKALNELGFKTRSHHVDEHVRWVTVLLDEVELEIRTVDETQADRDCFNGRKEILLRWTGKP